MNPAVPAAEAGALELLEANITLEGPLSCVTFQVVVQAVSCIQLFFTLGALESPSYKISSRNPSFNLFQIFLIFEYSLN